MVVRQPRYGRLCFLQKLFECPQKWSLHISALFFTIFRIPPSLMRSLCSWYKVQCFTSEYVSLFGTKNEKSTSPECVGARGELSFVKLFVKFCMKKSRCSVVTWQLAPSCWSQYWRCVAKFFTDCQTVFLTHYCLKPFSRQILRSSLR